MTVRTVSDPTGAAAILLHRGIITREQFKDAWRRQAAWGSDVGYVLVGLGYVRPLDFHKALATYLDLPFVDLTRAPCDADLVEADQREVYIARRVLPWSREDGRVVLAAARRTPPLLTWADAHYGADGYRVVITSSNDIDWELQRLFRDRDSVEASEGLWQRRPDLSAKRVITPPQMIAGHGLITAMLAGLWWSPTLTAIAANTIVMLLHIATFVMKFLLTWIGGDHTIDVQVTEAEARAIPDEDLPICTILVPLFREGDVLPILADALRNLDYPLSKLDVKLALEETDHETIDAAKQLGLEGIFQLVRVPPSSPQTKPKACNYALRFARGRFLVIYDAEDQPEPDQLRKVVGAFAKGNPNLACVQARLNYYNSEENFLTRMFTLEYSQWFDFMLPGLHTLGIPLPLGGTSNHFRTDVLRRVGAWDPHNVTEDADLGVRLEQEKYHVGIVNSTTYEEANSQIQNWVRQRSRWIKGYMQTYLVHMRHPIRLWRSIGTTGFVGFQFFIGTPPLTLLINPLLWGVFALWLIMDPLWIDTVFPGPVLAMALFNLLIANLLYLYFGVVAAFKRRLYKLAIYGLLQPIYWLLHSWAAYIALYQLVIKPHFWEKTNHGISAGAKNELSRVGHGRAADV